MTGYTYQLVEKDQNFNQFVWTCARAFGALIHMRDEDLDAPINLEENSESSYHKDRLKEEKDKLDQLVALKPYDREGYGQLLKRNNIGYCKEGLDKAIAERDKMEGMLSQVLDWTPPSNDHVNLKNFMLNQLGESLKYNHTDYYRENLEKAYGADPMDLFADALDSCKRSIVYHEENIAKDALSSEGNNEWLQKLIESVGPPQ